jgi:hypothetical protein
MVVFLTEVGRPDIEAVYTDSTQATFNKQGALPPLHNQIAAPSPLARPTGPRPTGCPPENPDGGQNPGIMSTKANQPFHADAKGLQSSAFT